MTTDASEKGIEFLIIRHMTGLDGLSVSPAVVATTASEAGTGYFVGSPKDFDRAQALDVPELFAFLNATQPIEFQKLGIADANDPKDINRLKFLARLSTEIGKSDVIDVIRKGIHGPRAGVDSGFHKLMFRTTVYKQQVNRYSTGIVSDGNRLYWKSFKQMPNVLIPKEEQTDICLNIQEQTGALDTAMAGLEREIHLLREYRNRLATDVVTDKLGVRKVAAELPKIVAPAQAEDCFDVTEEPDEPEEEVVT